MSRVLAPSSSTVAVLLLAAALPEPLSAHRAQSGTSAPGTTTADVTQIHVSPDGARVAYFADPETDDAFELFGVPILGGPSVRLGPRPVAGGDVVFALFSPDSRRVVFVGDLDADQVFELWAAPVSGRPPVKLSPPMVAGGDVFPFANLHHFVRISPDSRRVVFLADAERDGVVELYSAHLAGGQPVKLNLPLSSTGAVRQFRLSSGGDRVVYLAAGSDAPSETSFELYSVPIGGGASTKLNLPLQPGSTVATQEGFEVASSKRVVYAVGSLLYAVSELGGPSLELADTGRSRAFFRLDPSGQRVYYVAATGGFATEVRSVPIDGGPSTLLSLAGSPDRITGFVVGAERWLVYYVDNGDSISAVYGAPTGGGPVIGLERPAGGEILGAELTPDERRVITQLHTGDIEWHSIPMLGGPATVLLTGWDSGGLSSPDSNRFVYRDPAFELFSVPVAGGTPLALSPPMVDGGGVQRFVVSPDSRRVVYTADQDVDELFELYSVPLAGGVPIQLSPEFGSPH